MYMHKWTCRQTDKSGGRFQDGKDRGESGQEGIACEVDASA